VVVAAAGSLFVEFVTSPNLRGLRKAYQTTPKRNFSSADVVGRRRFGAWNEPTPGAEEIAFELILVVSVAKEVAFERDSLGWRPVLESLSGVGCRGVCIDADAGHSLRAGRLREESVMCRRCCTL
jgi:hypothetical protein